VQRGTHKSDLGLVRLGVDGEESVRRAVTEIESVLRVADPEAAGVVVAAMAVGVECLVGAMRDPVFGPVILVGSGGTDVETIQDIAVLLPPIGPQEIREAIARLDLARRLAARRGAPAGDIEALVAAVLAAQNLMTDPAEGILSIGCRRRRGAVRVTCFGTDVWAQSGFTGRPAGIKEPRRHCGPCGTAWPATA
jgi:hypothetical protein